MPRQQQSKKYLPSEGLNDDVIDEFRIPRKPTTRSTAQSTNTARKPTTRSTAQSTNNNTNTHKKRKDQDSSKAKPQSKRQKNNRQDFNDEALPVDGAGNLLHKKDPKFKGSDDDYYCNTLEILIGPSEKDESIILLQCLGMGKALCDYDVIPFTLPMTKSDITAAWSATINAGFTITKNTVRSFPLASAVHDDCRKAWQAYTARKSKSNSHNNVMGQWERKYVKKVEIIVQRFWRFWIKIRVDHPSDPNLFLVVG